MAGFSQFFMVIFKTVFVLMGGIKFVYIVLPAFLLGFRAKARKTIMFYVLLQI